MLTVEQNDRLTLVGPGTPMGELMRRYWQPIAGVSEFNENPTKAIRLLGEDLVLYKDESGTFGLIDASCAHRRVNMLWGIPEPKGLRCSYHGWLYDETGQCLEMPAEPADSTFPSRVQLKAYPGGDARRARVRVPRPTARSAAPALLPVRGRGKSAKHRLDGRHLQLAPDHGELAGPHPRRVPPRLLLQVRSPAGRAAQAPRRHLREASSGRERGLRPLLAQGRPHHAAHLRVHQQVRARHPQASLAGGRGKGGVHRLALWAPDTLPEPGVRHWRARLPDPRADGRHAHVLRLLPVSLAARGGEPEPAGRRDTRLPRAYRRCGRVGAAHLGAVGQQQRARTTSRGRRRARARAATWRSWDSRTSASSSSAACSWSRCRSWKTGASR